MNEPSAMPDPRTRFTDRVGDYVRYRPDYPLPLLEELQEVGLGPGKRVADLGSGTGIFTALLLGSGAEVFAVEPNEAMREAAEQWLGADDRFHSIAGSAETTGLEEHSVDLVTAAQAFHWFDEERARKEFRRILRPGGMVALVWNSRRTESTPFLSEYEALLRRYGTDYAQIDHRRVDTNRMVDFFGGSVELRSFPHAQRLDRQGLQGRLLSSSYTPPEGHTDRQPMLRALDEIYQRHAEADGVTIEYDTELYLGTLL